jgi:hypothetical protein
MKEEEKPPWLIWFPRYVYVPQSTIEDIGTLVDHTKSSEGSGEVFDAALRVEAWWKSAGGYEEGGS